jgi:class 3 adenylate cyclase/tetratricopeptide (TPR) repeat protein
VEQAESPTFGELLRQWRIERGWTQEKLGTVAGLSIEAIGTLERGVRQRPRGSTVRLLADAFELSESDRLLFEEMAHGARLPRRGRSAVRLGTGTRAEPMIHTFLMAQIRACASMRIEQEAARVSKPAAQFALHAGHATAARAGDMIEQRDDQALAIFPSPRHGLIAALDLQARFDGATCGAGSSGPSIGIAVVTGAAMCVDGGYSGDAVRVAARLCPLAGPGEVLTTDSVVQRVRAVDGLQYVNRGSAQLRGLSDPVQVVEVQRFGAPEAAGRKEGGTPTHDERSNSRCRAPIGSFLGALPARHIVSRQRELRQLTAALDVAAGGTGQLVLLAGEAGAGKTRLAQEVGLILRNQGFLVATGRCYEPQESTAFYPFVDALAAAFAMAPQSVSSQARRRWPYLGRLVPDRLESHPVSSEPADTQQRLFYAVSGFLQALAESCPVALMLDDLQWADASSLGLLQHLARQTRGDRVFLLGAYRDAETRSHPLLRGALRVLDREGLVAIVDVQCLDLAGTSDLIGSIMDEAAVSEEFAHVVHSRTEGNPYFIEQTLRTMVERGDIFRTEGSWDRKAVEEMDVPENVRSVVSQRVARLSGETQMTLRKASVLGQAFEYDDLQGMGIRSETDLDTALDEAAVAGLVRPVSDDRYRFDHALTRQTLYEELSPRAKRNLHLAAGTALEGAPSGRRTIRAAQLAHHFLVGNDDRKACSWSMIAGDRAADVFAYDEAAQHYHTAVRLAEGLRDASAHVYAMERLGRIYRLAARHDEALETLERAATHYHDMGDIRGEARVLAQIGRLYFAQGVKGEGIRRIRPILAHLEGIEPQTGLHGVVAELNVVMAHLLSRSGAYVESASAAALASEFARRANDDGLLAEAEFRRGTALSHAGDFQQGFQAMKEAIALAEAAEDLDTESQAIGNLALFHWDRGEMREARLLIVRALEISRQINDPNKVVDKLGDLAWADFTQGEWSSARRHLEGAQQILQSVGQSWVRPHHALRLGELCLATGQDAEGLHLVETGRDLAEADGNLLAECEAAYVLSDDALFSGNAERARSHLQRFFDRHAAALDGAALQTWCLALFARVYAELGEIERAEALLTRISDGRIVAHLDNVHSVRAVVAAYGRKWDEAERYASEGLAFARRGKFVVAEARLLYFWGRWLVTKGETECARERLSAALSIFRELGARPYVSHIEEMM